MTKMKKLLAGVFCLAALCFALTGCSSSAPAAEEEKLPEAEEPTVEIQKETEPFYVLVVGNDSRTGTVDISKQMFADGLGRSDTIMLVRVDPATYDICIITIPRDTAADVNGQTQKINDAYRQGGISALADQVTQLTGVTPKYYLDLGFVTFEDFIDACGGVDVNVPVAVTLQDIVAGGDEITVGTGEQTLDGVQALVFTRARHEYGDNVDACRQIQDRQVVESLISKVLSDTGNTSTYTKALSEFADTDWDGASMAALVEDFVAHSDQVVIRSGTGPYAGDIDPTVDMWLAYRDEATWASVIEVAENGGDLNAVVPLPEVYPAA